MEDLLVHTRRQLDHPSGSLGTQRGGDTRARVLPEVGDRVGGLPDAVQELTRGGQLRPPRLVPVRRGDQPLRTGLPQRRRHQPERRSRPEPHRRTPVFPQQPDGRTGRRGRRQQHRRGVPYDGEGAARRRTRPLPRRPPAPASTSTRTRRAARAPAVAPCCAEKPGCRRAGAESHWSRSGSCARGRPYRPHRTTTHRPARPRFMAIAQQIGRTCGPHPQARHGTGAQVEIAGAGRRLAPLLGTWGLTRVVLLLFVFKVLVFPGPDVTSDVSVIYHGWYDTLRHGGFPLTTSPGSTRPPPPSRSSPPPCWASWTTRRRSSSSPSSPT